MEYDDTGVPAPRPAPREGPRDAPEVSDNTAADSASNVEGPSDAPAASSDTAADSSAEVGERLAGLRERPEPGFETQRLRNRVIAELFDEPVEPKKIGRFTIVRRLGSGGMGVVYVAYDERLDRKVAVKLLRGGTVSPVARARLEREAKAMARLSHPNVVTVYEVGPFEDQVFIAMEFVEGEDLRSWSEAGARPWRAIVAMFLQAGAGLAAAHDAGIVHRDFKPDNVLVGHDGRARVADFGLANAFEAEPDPHDDDAAELLTSCSLTQTGAVMGTPAYMAPEQHAGGSTDARTDQFSFCVALWEALYDQRPFDTRDYGRLVRAVSRGKLREPPSDAQIPAWLHAIVRRGLEVEPARRWPSMRALLDALARDPEVRRRRLARAVIAGATIAATIAALSWVAAAKVRDAARDRYWSAVSEDLLELERERGLRQTRDDARRARDAARMSLMRDYMPRVDEIEREDPTAAAALLLEVSEEARASPEWISAANMLLGEPLSHRVLEHGDAITPLLFSPDGQWLYAGTANGEVWRWDHLAGTGEMVTQHAGLVTELALSPDGLLLASAAEDGGVWLWDARSGRSERLAHAGASVRALAFSPDAELLIFGGELRQLGRVELATGTRASSSTASPILDLTFTPDGEQILAAHADNTVRELSTRGLQLDRTLLGHQRAVYHVRTLADGRILSAADDGSARLWPANDDVSGDEGRVLAQHAEAITALRIDPEQRRIATAATDGTIQISELEAPYAQVSLPAHPKPVWDLVFTPSGEHLISGSFDHTARRMRSDGLGVPQIYQGHDHGLYRLALEPGGRWLATGSYDTTVRLWDLDQGSLSTPLRGHEGAVLDVALDRPQTHIATISRGGTAQLWAVDNGVRLAKRELEQQIAGVDLSPDGELVALAGERAWLWAPASDALTELDGHTSFVVDVEFDRSGTRLATASHDGTARVWDVASGAQLHRLDGHDGEVTHVDFEPGGARLVTAAADGLVRLWSLDDGSLAATLRGHTANIIALARSPDGRTLATSAYDNSVRLWKSERSVDAVALDGDTRPVWSLDFDPTGELLAAGSLSGLVRVWSTDTGLLLHELRYDESVWAVAFGREDLLLSGLNDGTLRARSLSSDQELVLTGHDSGIVRLAVSNARTFALSGAADQRARIWSLDTLSFEPDELFTRLRAATTFCLPPARRIHELGESLEMARASARACADTHQDSPS